MRKSVAFIAIFFNAWCFSQEFQFQLNFEDAVGNKDSIVLGYDPMASDSIDLSFGELNIIDTAWKSGLDVRLSNNWDRTLQGDHATFHTKRQIIQTQCNGYEGVNVPINVLTANWPITISWDSLLFQEECRKASLLNCTNWMLSDVFPLCDNDLYITFMSGDSKIMVSERLYLKSGLWDDEYYFYKNTAGDTVSTFWFWFSSTGSTGIDELRIKQQLDVFPNPTNSLLNIKLPENFTQAKRIWISDQLGQVVLKTRSPDDIDVSALASGLYRITLEDEQGLRLTGRFVRE